MRNRRAIYILALILSLASVVLLSRYIQGLKNTPETVVTMENVIVAVADIPAQTKITEEMLAIQALPPEAIHPLAARTKDEIVGSITRVDVSAQEQFLKNKVALDEVTLVLSYRIPEDMRAIAIPINEVMGVGGYIEKDDRVDLIITYELPTEPESAANAPGAVEETTEPEEPLITTITQIQNLEVIEVGPLTFTEEGIAIRNRGVTTSIVLLAKPAQAEMIAYAIQTGTIQVSLRNPLDQEILAPSQFNQDNFEEWRTR